jgi:hypothetical protein
MTDTDLYLPIRAVLLAFVTDLIMLTGSAGTANKAWNGLAFGAAAGPLDPAVVAAARPDTTAPAGRVKDASRSFGPACGRP